MGCGPVSAAAVLRAAQARGGARQARGVPAGPSDRRAVRCGACDSRLAGCIDDRALFSGGGVPDEGPVFSHRSSSGEFDSSRLVSRRVWPWRRHSRRASQRFGGVAHGGVRTCWPVMLMSSAPRVQARLQLRRDGRECSAAAGLAGRPVRCLAGPTLLRSGCRAGRFRAWPFWPPRGSSSGEGVAEMRREDVRPAGQQDEAGGVRRRVAVWRRSRRFAARPWKPSEHPWRRFSCRRLGIHVKTHGPGQWR